MMAKFKFKKELQSIREGMPYTWGIGKDYYVLLGGLVHSIGTSGIIPEPQATHLIYQLDEFRYATEIEIKD